MCARPPSPPLCHRHLLKQRTLYWPVCSRPEAGTLAVRRVSTAPEEATVIWYWHVTEPSQATAKM